MQRSRTAADRKAAAAPAKTATPGEGPSCRHRSTAVTAGGAARRLSRPAPVPDLVPGHVRNSTQERSQRSSTPNTCRNRGPVVRRLCLRKSADPLVRQAWSFTRRLFSLPSQGTAESRQSAQCGTARAATRRARRRAQRSGRSPDTGTPPGWERPATWLRSGPQSCWRRPETAVMRRRPERPGDWRFSSQNSSQNLPAIAEGAGVTARAVHKWIYTARKRGIMPPGTRGRVG